MVLPQSSLLGSRNDIAQSRQGGTGTTHFVDDSEMSFTASRSPVSRKLEDDLYDARMGGLSQHSYYVPISDIERLITVRIIEEIIQEGHPSMAPTKSRRDAETAKTDAKKLFAILALQGRGAAICSFLENKISDKDLPFMIKKVGNKWSLSSPVRCSRIFESWGNREVEGFDRKQWWMNTPVFDKDNSHCQEFVDQIILLFSPIEEDGELNEGHDAEIRGGTFHTNVGGYSEVNAYHIHPAHHNFWPWNMSLSLV